MPIRLRRNAKPRTLEELVHLIPDEPVDEEPAPPTADPEQRDEGQTPAPPFLLLQELAEWLCVSLSTVKRMISKGDLGTVRVGTRRKIPAAYLTAYVARDILLPSQISNSGSSLTE